MLGSNRGRRDSFARVLVRDTSLVRPTNDMLDSRCSLCAGQPQAGPGPPSQQFLQMLGTGPSGSVGFEASSSLRTAGGNEPFVG
jgi:hypothetical protein